MKVYKYIILAMMVLLYSCGGGGGGNGDYPASNDGGTGTGAGAGSGGSGSGTTVTSGSMVFNSATPQVIGIRETGHTTTSLFTFSFYDSTGTAVSGATIDFVLQGPSGGKLPANGGEYIGASDSSPTTASATTSSSGVATVYLNSGLVAGTATITATANGTSITATSTPISIGGGVPNDTHLTIATDLWNLEGLEYTNITANISAYLADRFSNYNVLEGTTVTFQTESGAINTADPTSSADAVVDEDGIATVVFRTQNPPPASPGHPEGKDVVPMDGSTCATPSTWTSYGSDWESCLQAYVLATYSITTTRHPRDGWSTVMVRTGGEEGFDDANGNGIYDATETFYDTVQEPYLDINDNNTYDDGTGADPFEEYVDDDGLGSHDGANGSWDANKSIFKDLTLLITGSPAYIATNPSTFTVSNGGSQTFSLLVSDINLNALIPGTTVSIATDKGKITGTSSYTFPNAFIRGPVELTFILSDSTATDTDPAEAAVITITVTYKGTAYTRLITGTVD